ncbi:hypothetical protein B0I22_2562 [Epilithonimonas xixisoli]|uniref:Uncharacterized protein n=1 Tax=Epilithonimonas xixisoli TaxID=1476462 RepID=A0A4R8I2T6_9FLAO|nr:hypothetical protein B0I22_2562 [Epilithonimonas xixisoli]
MEAKLLYPTTKYGIYELAIYDKTCQNLTGFTITLIISVLNF